MTTVDDADSRTFEAVILLYLACSKLPDDELSEAEAERILVLAHRHTAGLAPSYAEQVVQGVAAELAGLSDVDARLARVAQAAELVGRTLSVDAKEALVDELRSIARADGTVTPGEREFVRAVAQTFGLDPD